MKKGTLLLAAAFTALWSLEAQAGEWKRDGVGLWYQKDDGSYAVGWFQDEDGSRYYFDENGYAVTGWFEENHKDYYFLPGSGKLAVGYATIMDQKLYYFDENGVSRKIDANYTGWVKDGIRWYYQLEDGSICRNDWKQVGGVWYHFDENGYMQTGALVLDGVQYYLEENGAMAVNCRKTIDGVVYEFDGSGAGKEYVEPPAAEPVPAIPEAPAASSDAGRRQTSQPSRQQTPQTAARTQTSNQDSQTADQTSDGAASQPASEETDAAAASGSLIYTNPAVPAEEAKSEQHKQADQMADQILASIVNDSMTKRQKAEAIFAWVRGNFRYSGSSATRDWGVEAYQGFRRKRGDCFTYFSVSHELLTRCGIESMMIVRSTDNHHYWNLVLVEEGWYHFDTCPRAAGGYFCLWTNAQMAAYSAKHNNCFAFDQSLYPAIQ